MLMSLFLMSCGDGGETESGFGENAIDDVSPFIGVYKGEEIIKLLKEENDEEVEQQTNEVTIIINENGLLRISTSGGTTGSAQIRNDKVFELRSNASTQFDGQCSAGVILLSGSVSVNQVDGKYSSSNLICNKEAYRIEGEFTATR